jgi:hypothetical protein
VLGTHRSELARAAAERELERLRLGLPAAHADFVGHMAPGAGKRAARAQAGYEVRHLGKIGNSHSRPCARA